MERKFYRVDGVLWSEDSTDPFCQKHKMEMDAYNNGVDFWLYNLLQCEECPEQYTIPRSINEQKTYIERKLESKKLQNITVINLDDEAIPIAEDKVISKDGKYFVRSLLTESKVGQRLVVYVGERGRKEKSQIFVEPAIKRLAFDQKDIHPSDIFIELKGTFSDGSSMTIRKENK